jgi:hypothetical protein
MRILIIISALVIIVSSCSYGTVKPFLKDEKFQESNLPIRTIKILLFTDSTCNQATILNFVEKCSRMIGLQVGMRLQVVSIQSVNWGKRAPGKMIEKVYTLASKSEVDYDIAIAFTNGIAVTDIVLPTTERWCGVIDDFHRRYIVLRSMDSSVFLHEFFHAFIFSKTHSKGIMMSRASLIGTSPLWLDVEDRDEVLRNKWRKFSMKDWN